MIRKATEKDIDEVAKGYEELFDYEDKNGSTTNWVRDVYPTRETAKKGVDAGTLYVLEENGKICAHMILNDDRPPHYDAVAWEYPAKPNEIRVIHTLCVLPSMKGHGYATQMVNFAIDRARSEGCKALQIDTEIGNIPAQTLYKKAGFRLAGQKKVLHEGVLERTLVFLEYKL